ncbi:MAG: hypothetical protein ABI467_05890 [Kofleriaceae bacterium]
MYARCSLLLVWLGCGNAPLLAGDGPAVPDGHGATLLDATRADAHTNADTDAASSLDGTPTRQPCTSQFGTALPSSGTFGRLDGYLVAIVAPGQTSGCNDDDSHVHLQIKMNGAIYDIAIDATDGQTHIDDVHTGTIDIAMPSGPAWTEGFHTGVTVDYPALGVHATALPLFTKAQIVTTLTGDLATANHVSIYTTTYGGDGAHLVHRDGGGHDGLLVTQPLASPSHVRMLSFSDQAF